MQGKSSKNFPRLTINRTAFKYSSYPDSLSSSFSHNSLAFIYPSQLASYGLDTSHTAARAEGAMDGEGTTSSLAATGGKPTD